MNAVTIILERDFGERLAEFASNSHVWLVDTADNRSAVEKLWTEGNKSITTFRFNEAQTNGEICLGILDTVDLHHNYPSKGHCQSIEVIGSTPKPTLEPALKKLGFTHFEETANGFRATR